MSRNSEQFNDENLLEIRDQRIAAIYLAEFCGSTSTTAHGALAIDAKQHGTGTGTARARMRGSRLRPIRAGRRRLRGGKPGREGADRAGVDRADG